MRKFVRSMSSRDLRRAARLLLILALSAFNILLPRVIPVGAAPAPVLQ
jgi:hypothetical protein